MARRTRGTLFALISASLLAAAGIAAAQVDPSTFVNFESGHTRPLALSPDGSRLFALNTPDNRLAIFDVTADGLDLVGEVQVGMDPVAVAARTNTEVWVVNHLSDSVSIVTVDLADPTLSEVTNTLFTCDEPRDIVFASGTRAFITTARRGQNCPVAPEYATEGIGRALVQVFDATALGGPLGGTPIANVVLFTDTPRGLAVSPDGTTVYAAGFHSGNQTTAILEPVVTGSGGLPPPPASATPGGPNVGLIVKLDPTTGTWRDERGLSGPDWSPSVRLALPDTDVFEIDATGNPPAETNSFSHVGTVIFNLAVHPSNGKVYVSNTEARNHVRFEGIFPDGLHGVRGHIAESRITVIDGGAVLSHHLNPHIDYSKEGNPAEAEQSLAFPMEMVFSADGSEVYVAGFGSGKLGILDTAQLEGGTISSELISVGGGVSGLALDAPRNRLYVLSRFQQRVNVVTDIDDPEKRGVTGGASLHFDPSPASVREGRPFLYDTAISSAHGDSSCASCHIFGDFDSLAWDLGDASVGAPILPNPNPFIPASAVGNDFHPLKGPMTTQSLRGMAGFGPMHWRGDRTGGHVGGDPLDEDLAFKEFNPAFVGLLGRSEELEEHEMQAFTDFILQIPYPPNPNRALDNSLNASEQSGEDFFLNVPTDGGTCDRCHTFPFGSDGRSTFEGETQEFKVPHQRNMYQKVGMFGTSGGVGGIPGTPFTGDQVRGFGYLHDGGIATLFDFVSAAVFQNLTDPLRRDLESFMLASESNFVPAVGQQVSNTPANFTDPAVVGRLDLLQAQADNGDCDLIIKGVFGGELRGAVYLPPGQFRSDRSSDPLFTDAVVRGLPSQGATQVYTCVPPGSGVRMGIDRDTDGFPDADERDAGSDPDDPRSTPNRSVTDVEATTFKMTDDHAVPINLNKRKLTFKSNTKKSPAGNKIVAPGIGSAGDPMQNGGGVLRIFNANGGVEQVTLSLPASGWLPLGSGGFRYKGTGNDPVTSVLVKSDLIRIKVKGPTFDYTLDEPRQGRLGLRLTLGDAVEWCAEAGARVTGKKPTTEKTDKVDKFLAEKKAPASASCAVPPEG